MLTVNILYTIIENEENLPCAFPRVVCILTHKLSLLIS